MRRINIKMYNINAVLFVKLILDTKCKVLPLQYAYFSLRDLQKWGTLSLKLIDRILEE